MRLVFFGGATGKEQENRQVESFTAAVLAHDWGRPALALVAGILGAVAVGNLVHAIRARFRNQFARERMSAAMRVIVTTCGRLGYAARALVFAAATWLFARAALQSDPREAGGMAQALDELLRGPYGRWLLGLAGAGFVAYGLFGWALIRYRRLPREPDGRR
jgi:hypothetical protein